MNYIKVKWIHQFKNEPVELYSELDDNRNETRKIEVFNDDQIGYATLDRQTYCNSKCRKIGSTYLWRSLRV